MSACGTVPQADFFCARQPKACGMRTDAEKMADGAWAFRGNPPFCLSEIRTALKIHLEHAAPEITLTPVMTVKLAITLILGLVFQLAQVLPAAVITSPCQMEQESCGCCTAGKSCHCAENEDRDQQPSPAPFDAGRTLKIPEMKSTETRVSLESVRKLDPATMIASLPDAGFVTGYTGVRLSVAFCSFVI